MSVIDRLSIVIITAVLTATPVTSWRHPMIHVLDPDGFIPMLSQASAFQQPTAHEPLPESTEDVSAVTFPLLPDLPSSHPISFKSALDELDVDLFENSSQPETYQSEVAGTLEVRGQVSSDFSADTSAPTWDLHQAFKTNGQLTSEPEVSTESLNLDIVDITTENPENTLDLDNTSENGDRVTSEVSIPIETSPQNLGFETISKTPDPDSWTQGATNFESPSMDFVSLSLNPASTSTEVSVDVTLLSNSETARSISQSQVDLTSKVPLLLFAVIAFCVLPIVNTLNRWLIRLDLVKLACCINTMVNYGPVTIIWTLLWTEPEGSLSIFLWSLPGIVWVTVTIFSVVSTSLTPFNSSLFLKLSGFLLDVELVIVGYMQIKFDILFNLEDLIGFEVPNYCIGIFFGVYIWINALIIFYNKKNGRKNITTVIQDDNIQQIIVDERLDKTSTLTGVITEVHSYVAPAGRDLIASTSNSFCSITIEEE